MSKYIIELEDDIKYLIINGRADNRCYTLVRPVTELELLNSDYINEHFGDLQDEAYQCGLNDAWEAAKKIFGYEIDGALNIDELKKAFGSNVYCTADIIRANTAAQAIAKLKAYEEKQKEDEVKVGDEVAFHHDDGRPDTVVVVTYIGKDGFIDGMDGRGTQYAHKNPTKWTKTGRHFNIDKILEEMQK